jgi:hypothetical protein
VHGVLRAADWNTGQLARPTEFEANADVTTGGLGADWKVKITAVKK